MSDIFENMSKKLEEQFDNELAKAFLMKTGNALLEKGIRIYYTKNTIESHVEETEYGRVYEDTYAINFDNVDTSEHDAKIRVDVLDDFQKWLKSQVVGLDNCSNEVLVAVDDRWELAIERYKEEKKNDRSI